MIDRSRSIDRFTDRLNDRSSDCDKAMEITSHKTIISVTFVCLFPYFSSLLQTKGNAKSSDDESIFCILTIGTL